MAESYAEKLDLIMRITGTGNAALGRALSFDPSYISRIRNGKRGLPTGQPFLAPAAAYLAGRVQNDYQKKLLAEAMSLPAWPENRQEAEGALLAFLTSKPRTPSPLEEMLKGLAEAMRTQPAGRSYGAEPGTAIEAMTYYGAKGKRDGVFAFLTDLAGDGEPHELLLRSDEDMSWLVEDPSFARSWLGLMSSLIEHGSRIKIIHSISRDGSEMWEAVRSWLPLYLSGAIEPLYCPRLRDGICRRTIFIARDRQAFISHSVTGQQGNRLNLLLRDKSAVAALTEEFEAYARLCKPLMDIVRASSPKELSPVIRAYLEMKEPVCGARTPGAVLLCRDGVGALVVTTAEPFVAFSITEGRMVSALWNYLEGLPSGSTSAALAALEAWVR